LIPSTSNVGENFGAEVVPAWKQELNERLAATRSRRLRIRGEQVALPGMEPAPDKEPSRASRLAAKVAQRYANAPSYSEVLTNNAQAKIDAAVAAAAAAVPRATIPQVPSAAVASEIEPQQDEAMGTFATHAIVSHADEWPVAEEIYVPEIHVTEIQEEPVVEPLAVNLVEYPRELVAARKVRPRLAEGPLREETDQLQIFEVAPESVSQKMKIGAAATDWLPIRLDTDPVESEQPRAKEIPLCTATIEDRVMAGIFDLALVVAAFALFVLVFVACTSHPPTGKPALIGAVLAWGALFVLYQYLFFKFADGTPGMRYAKIALCTFEDENPTREAMCRRVFFLLLSAAPLGLGFLWACFDPDRLGWHDRMSRIYQRSYS
jgi:uncharacterized RDD family membrane protein YckC